MYKIVFALVSLALLSGCDSEFTSSIKKSEYSPYNRTIEDIFEKTEYCSSVEWDEIEYKGTKLLRGACLINQENGVSDMTYLIYHFKRVNDTVAIHNAYYGDKDKKVWGGGNRGKVSNREAHQFLRYLFIDNIK